MEYIKKSTNLGMTFFVSPDDFKCQWATFNRLSLESWQRQMHHLDILSNSQNEIDETIHKVTKQLLSTMSRRVVMF